tara:strand:+ start:8708 stop:9724 length:1017 start_codon:yes stop_codon:yes gene_type:complete
MLDQVIPESFIIEKFYENAGYPRYKKISNIYEGGCPLCREGKSWGKKRRLYYIVKDNNIFCHNCGWSGTPLKWIAEVEGINQFQVIREAKNIDHTYIPRDVEIQKDENNESLPGDSINLFDKAQTSFYSKDNKVLKSLEYIKERRLDTAINRPKTLWYCKDDYIHKDRIIIPFYNDNDIVFYQSRKLFSSDRKPKYLSKLNTEKSIFNFDNISPVCNYIFIFEGPIDSFFVSNGIAVGGIQSTSANTFTQFQQSQINKYPFYKKVWVLDNQHVDESAKNKTRILLKEGHTCFIWPRELKMFKDFNDICVRGGRDEITSPFILSNTFRGVEGLVKLNLT